MKKLLILLALLVFLPFRSQAEEQKTESYWTCFQVGTMEVGIKESYNTLAISDIYVSNGSYDKNAEKFLKIIKKQTKDRFMPSFEPSCVENQNYGKIVKLWEDKIRTAMKRKFMVFHIILSNTD